MSETTTELEEVLAVAGDHMQLGQYDVARDVLSSFSGQRHGRSAIVAAHTLIAIHEGESVALMAPFANRISMARERLAFVAAAMGAHHRWYPAQRRFELANCDGFARLLPVGAREGDHALGYNHTTSWPWPD